MNVCRWQHPDVSFFVEKAKEVADVLREIQAEFPGSAVEEKGIAITFHVSASLPVNSMTSSFTDVLREFVHDAHHSFEMLMGRNTDCHTRWYQRQSRTSDFVLSMHRQWLVSTPSCQSLMTL